MFLNKLNYHLRIEGREMVKVEWFGHACFLIVSSDGTRILTDPYEPGFRGLISYAPINVAADIVTVSHEHADHNYVQGVLGNPEVIRSPGSHTVRDIEFFGLLCYHDKVQGKERGSNTVFRFSVDNLKICHMGDLGHILSDSDLASLGTLDVLLIPTGGPAATLELGDAVSLWEKLKPRLVIPMHFKTEKCTFPKYSIEDLTKVRPSARKINSSSVEITEETLPDQTSILILNHSR